MVRKLTNKDEQQVLRLLYKEPSYNIFFIGDIENFGFEDENVEAWGDYNFGELSGVLLRYYDHFLLYYDHDDFDAEPFKNIMRNCPHKIDIMSGKPNIIDKFKDLFPGAKLVDTYFCELKKPIDITGVDIANVRQAKEEDAEKICELQNTIEEFSAAQKPDRVRQTIEKNAGRIYYISDGDKMISIAQTTAENSKSAMIVGVCTHIDYRKKGYMRKVMTKLCYDLQKENKLLCLFYDNKDAGRIYHSQGFETIGKWYMLKIK